MSVFAGIQAAPGPPALARWQHARRRGHITLFAVIMLLLALSVWAVQDSVIPGTDWRRMDGFAAVLMGFGRFLPPDPSLLPTLFAPALQTILIAIVGTLLGALMSLTVALLGAANLRPLGAPGYILARGLMTMSRSIHEIVWALIFVSAVGLGAFAGILALACRSVGFVSKLLAEAIERIDMRQVEALRAQGASPLDMIRHAIIPQLLPIGLSTLIFEWDININRAAVLGLVGAGGLGLSFHNQLIASNYAGVTTVLLAILAVILVGEAISVQLRRRIV
ncbi:phosphonate ABC transporter, permease protein PhnE [Desulfobulbus alkaliphilus]|uniref:phosphonate ABC transporter, permease protein PhnE n=1 Tax=Desulfobulbus alkaliphilus TaxID=869814 RepID=UPI00196546DF|nr:phosphonate ABC transporter, permease protein PhnE [Desulfobulbus alkaliphilus]MBM9536106.1 phosphonate ABC transporter, permease protein PhnE [Desulfobulbus alkaliphilus]